MDFFATLQAMILKQKDCQQEDEQERLICGLSYTSSKHNEWKLFVVRGSLPVS